MLSNALQTFNTIIYNFQLGILILHFVHVIYNKIYYENFNFTPDAVKTSDFGCKFLL